jgi:hypothetical protein
MSNLVMFRQGHVPGANDLLGYNTDRNFTLAKQGCLVTSFAMFTSSVSGETWTPQRLNNHLKANNGFAPGGGLLYWQAIPRLFPFIQPVRITTDKNELHQWLGDLPNYAIIKLNGGAHYAWAPSQGKMIDPIDGKPRGIAQGYSFTSAHLYRVVAGKGSGATSGTITTSTTTRDFMGRSEQSYIDEINQLLHGPRGGSSIDELTNANYELNVKLTAANQTIAELQRQAQTVVMLDWQRTYREDAKTLVAVRDGVARDLAGANPDYLVVTGMRLMQAGTFVKDGQVYRRSKQSAEQGVWYGYSVDDFPDTTRPQDPPTSDTVHANLGQAYGLLERVRLWARDIFKKANHKD